MTIVIGILVVVGIGWLIYYLFFTPKAPELLACNQGCTDNSQCQSGHCFNGFCRNADCENSADCLCLVESNDGIIVRQDFAEDFRDGEIDDFWQFDNHGKDANSYQVDYIKEQLVLTAMAGTSQWSSDDLAPTLYFLTDRNFEITVEMEFDPRSDFQHAGLGLINQATGEWARVSRSYDSHSLQDPQDQPNTVYVMEKKVGAVLKYKHDNYRDVRVFLRMTRENGSATFAYSRDQKEWTVLDQVDVTGYPDEVGIYLFAYSTNQTSIEAIYKYIDFQVLE